MTEKKTPMLQVHISDYELMRTLDACVKAAIDEQVGKSIEKHIDEVIGEVLTERIKAIVDARIVADVERRLTEGWARTNEWGQKQGEVINLDSTVRERLKAFVEGNPSAYSQDEKKSKLQRVIEQMAESDVKKALQPVIDEAKKQLQSQLDISIGKSLRLTLADALKG